MTVIQMNTTMDVDTEEYRAAKFEEFWKAYPLKKGKAKARALFMNITKPGGRDGKSGIKEGGQLVGMVDMHLEATCDELVEGARRFAKGLVNRQTFKMDLTYCPHATTWLNAGRWEDE